MAYHGGHGVLPAFSLLESGREEKWESKSNNLLFARWAVAMTRKGPYRVEEAPRKTSSLGQRIATIRKAWGWTQADLADRLRVQKATVSAWERGIASPNGISLIALAAVLNTTPEALLGEVRFTIPPLLEGVSEGTWRSYQLPEPADPSLVLLMEAGSAMEGLRPSALKTKAAEALAAMRPVWLVIG